MLKAVPSTCSKQRFTCCNAAVKWFVIVSYKVRRLPARKLSASVLAPVSSLTGAEKPRSSDGVGGAAMLSK